MNNPSAMKGTIDMMPAPFVRVGGARHTDSASLALLGLELEVREETHRIGRCFSLAVRNTSRRTILVESAGIAFLPAGKKGRRRWRVFLDQGQCGWCGVKRLESLEPDLHLQPAEERRDTPLGPAQVRFHRSDLQAVAWDASSGEAVIVGFLRQRHGVNTVDVIPGPGARQIVAIEAWQDLGLEIDPGMAQPLDPIVTGSSHDPYALLELFGAAVQIAIGRRFDDPPIVGMMTWYGYRTAIDEEIVRGNLRIIAELFGGYPQPMRNVMLLDHGWEEDANWGWWKPDACRFPRGMASIADEARGLGIDLGLWYTPFCITENAPNYQDIAPLRAVDETGEPYTGRACVWGDLPHHSRQAWPITYFDAGRTEVQTKWREELAEMKGWGARYWKLDFFDVRTSAAVRSRLGVGELYARTYRTFREAVGEAGHLAPCSCRTNSQLGYNDSVRIATDIGIAGTWPGAACEFRHGMATVAALWYKNRTFWVNDADSIQVAKGCSLGEARVRATVAALSGGHLMLSEDLRTVDAERIEMVRRLLPPCPKAARPIDLFDNPFPDGYPSLWSLSLETSIGPLTVLAVFNLSEATRTWTLTPHMLGIPSGQEFLALEWWQCRWLGTYSGSFTVEVPAEDVAIIHARRCGSVPSLVSVSHPITGGWIIEQESFDERTRVLSGTVATKAGIRLVLFGHLPRGWSLAREAGFHGSVSSAGGWQYELTTTAMRTAFSIGFENGQ